MPTALDDLMETASRALGEMDYPRCEALCVQALSQARGERDWAGYSRVVLPLQEARRQKRQAALEGKVRLGTCEIAGGPVSLLDGLDAGCLVVTPPLTTDDADRLWQAAEASRLPIELLYAGAGAEPDTWVVHSFNGPLYETPMPAPPAALADRWLPGQEAVPETPLTPAHWFMRANEALGNAALAATAAELGTIDRVEQLEQALHAVGDHELLHQALADAARAMHHGGPR